VSSGFLVVHDQAIIANRHLSGVRASLKDYDRAKTR
jgi:hypothetical protein